MLLLRGAFILTATVLLVSAKHVSVKTYVHAAALTVIALSVMLRKVVL